MSDGRLPTRRRWVGWVIVLAVVLIVFALGWVLIRGFGAVTELQTVRNSVGQLQEAIEDRDFGRAEKIAPRIEEHATLARDLTSDPVWRSFEVVPWIGSDFTALREVAKVIDDVAADALTPLLAVARDADLATLGLSGSQVSLPPLANLQDPLGTSATALAAADHAAQRIDTDATIPALADAIGDTRDLIHEASRTVGAMHGASRLLPTMLGGNGPRTYLVAIQNNAELRSGGGVVQAFLLMRADNGALSLVRTASASDFPALGTPLTTDEPLTASEATATLLGDAPGTVVRDATSMLEFAGAGETLALRWQQQYGEVIDGVVALDTAGAQRLLDVTGSVSFSGFTANSETLVPILASEVPATIADPVVQNAVVAEAMSALVTAALASDDPSATLEALSDVASDDRIQAWSVHSEEQEVLEASTLGGSIPKDGAEDAYVGVLLNDRTGGAMDFYADAAISTAIGVCNGDPVTQVRVTWTNGAPAEELPPSVTGTSDSEPGDTRTLIAIYGPEGADALETGDGQTKLDGRSIVQFDVPLSRGASSSVTATFVGSDAERFVHVNHTPMFADVGVTRSDVECE